jgi:hypothetical protein
MPVFTNATGESAGFRPSSRAWVSLDGELLKVLIVGSDCRSVKLSEAMRYFDPVIIEL